MGAETRVLVASESVGNSGLAGNQELIELTTTPLEVASTFSGSNFMEVGEEILPPRTTNPTSKSMAARIWEDNVKMSFGSLVGSENSLQERTAGGVTLVADAVVVVNVVNPVAWCIAVAGVLLSACGQDKDDSANNNTTYDLNDPLCENLSVNCSIECYLSINPEATDLPLEELRDYECQDKPADAPEGYNPCSLSASQLNKIAIEWLINHDHCDPPYCSNGDGYEMTMEDWCEAKEESFEGCICE